MIGDTTSEERGHGEALCQLLYRQALERTFEGLNEDGSRPL